MLFALLIGFAGIVPSLSAADRVQIFQAAGFHLSGGRWKSDDQCDDGASPSYSAGAIKPLGDLNRDGRPEVLVTEGGTVCYGNTGEGYTLLTRSAAGRWSVISRNTGIPTFLKTRANGWPDLEVGRPGFCFPVLRWTGKAYANHRQQYQGKPCRR